MLEENAVLLNGKVALIYRRGTWHRQPLELADVTGK
jgi:hypothetical protein